MHTIKAMFCGLALLGASAGSLAGSDSGIYIGGSLGSTSTSFDYSDSFDDVMRTVEDDDTSFKIFAGYNFGLIPTIDLAVETSYIDFGEANSDLVSTETTAWDVLGVAGFNFGPMGIFAKLGVAAWDFETAKKNVEYVSYKEDGSDLTYGFGVKAQLMSISIRAEYEVFDIEDVDTDMVSIGAAFTF